jgi:hypothetical protein
MWINYLCAKIGERGRHSFVFLFRPWARAAAMEQHTYRVEVSIVILRKGNTADHPWLEIVIGSCLQPLSARRY